MKLLFERGVELQVQCKVICKCSVRSHTQSSVKSGFYWGVDLPTSGLPNMSSQSRNEIWAVRAGICEIAV